MVLILSLAAAGHAQTVVFDSDFEISDLTEWNQGITCTPKPPNVPSTSCTISNDEPHSGVYGAKFVFPSPINIVQSMMRYNVAAPDGYPVIYARTFFYLGADLSTKANSDLQVLQVNSGGQAVQIHNSGTEAMPLYRLKLSGGPTGITIVNRGQWYCVTMLYSAGDGAGSATVYLDGATEPELVASGLTLRNARAILVGCLGYASGTIYFDDVLVSTSQLVYSTSNVRLRHANSFGRSMLPLKTYLWGWNHADSVIVTVDGVQTSVAAVNSGLIVPTVDMSRLSAGPHTVTVSLVSAGGVTKAETTEEIVKYGTGMPTVAINENNAIVYRGDPVFLVTPWSPGVSGNGYYMSDYLAHGYVNAFGWFGGWADNYNPAQWGRFVDSVGALGAPYPAIGPDTFRWCNEGVGVRCSNIPSKADNSVSVKTAQAYAAALANNPNIMGWTWDDEPNLGGSFGATPAVNLLRISEAVRAIDTNHLHFQNLGGYEAPGTDATFLTQRKNFLYPNLSETLDAAYTYPKLIAEVYSSDYYPFIYQKTDSTTLATWLSTLDSMRKYLFDLVPLMSFIEAGVQRCYDPPACTNAGTGYGPGHGPTAKQLKMEAWLAVIHGVKGISWWGPEDPYYTYIDSEHKLEMAAFTDAVTILKDVILSAPLPRRVTSNSTHIGNRVDVMAREHGGGIWVFSARVTECIPGNPPLTCESNTLSTQLSVSGLSGDQVVTVWGENRALRAVDGVFTDAFTPNAVHIYYIPQNGPGGR